MRIRFDWKFWVVLTVTIIGILVPVWLYRADLTSQSLHFRQISQTSLQPPNAAKALDLKISVAESELSAPYLTVFELINDGAKPVPSSDFESPIEVTSTNQALILRAGINETDPKDLIPSVLIEDGSMKIRPMLFNPGDSITISVLTTGGKPSFASRARIAGVRSVMIVETQLEAKRSIRGGLIMVTVALICLVASGLVINGWPSKGVWLRPRSAYLIFMVTTLAATFCMMVGLEAFDIKGYGPLFAAIFCGIVVATFVSAWFNKEKPIVDALSVKEM